MITEANTQLVCIHGQLYLHIFLFDDFYINYTSPAPSSLFRPAYSIVQMNSLIDVSHVHPCKLDQNFKMLVTKKKIIIYNKSDKEIVLLYPLLTDHGSSFGSQPLSCLLQIKHSTKSGSSMFPIT